MLSFAQSHPSGMKGKETNSMAKIEGSMYRALAVEEPPDVMGEIKKKKNLGYLDIEIALKIF